VPDPDAVLNPDITYPIRDRFLQTMRLAEDRLGPIRDALERLAKENARRNNLISALLVVTGVLLIVAAVGLL